MTREKKSDHRTFIRRTWYHICRYVMHIILVGYWRLRSWGVENIPQEGAVLVISNHQSLLDPPIVGCPSRRRMNFLARKTLFRFSFFGWLIDSVGAIPLNRDGMGIEGIKESLRRLKQGEILCVFPEGTRSEDGSLRALKPGFFGLAKKTKAAILVTVIDGAYQAWPRNKSLPRPGRVHVFYDKPISYEDYKDQTEEEFLERIANRMEECLAIIRTHPDFDRAE